MAYAGPKPVRKIDLLWVSVSAMVGSGWLFAPLYAAKIAGPAAILSWLLGSLLVALCAFTLAEIATMLPITGCITRFAQLSHGHAVGFAMAWCLWLAFIMVPVIEVQGLVQYAGYYFPNWVYHSNGQIALSYTGTLVCALLLSGLALLNLLPLTRIAQLNNQLSYLKIFVPLIMVIALIWGYGHWQNLHRWEFSPQGYQGVFAALPLAGIAFSFFGFNTAISFAQEVRDPQKAMPFALMGSLLVCACFYMLIQLAFVLAIPPAVLEQAGTWAQLQFEGEAGPFVGLSYLLDLPLLSGVLFALAVFSPLGSAFVMVASNARVQAGMSLQGYFPSALQHVNAQQVPVRALVANLAVGLIMLCLFPSWQQMAQVTIAAILFSHVFSPIAFLAFRARVPQCPRPFRIAAPIPVAYGAFSVLNLMLYWSGWHTLWKLGAILLVGYTLYIAYLYCTAQRHESVHAVFQRSAWLVAYTVGMAIISHHGQFPGGTAVIPAPLDTAAIFLLSAAILPWAVYAALPQTAVQAAIQAALPPHLSHEATE